jgi:dihydroorotate dehydrogenase electron transfer subunit
MTHEGAQNVVLVARGIGIAPLFSVGEEILKKNKNAKIFFLLGARKKERIFYTKECGEIGDVFIYSDDGSMGFHGRAPELLVHLLERKKLPDDLALYACGPALMLKDLADISGGFAIQGQVALESHMGCGFGACLSCSFPLKPESVVKNEDWIKPALQWSEDGQAVYSLICKDGPIYDIQEVDWDEWLA